MDNGFILRRAGDWTYYCLPDIERKGIRHGFFTRASPQMYRDLKEKEDFITALGLGDVVILRQEHGDVLNVVKNGERPTTGDGIILLERGVGAVIKTADCLSLIICDPTYPMASILHAGWRGTVKRITEKAIHEMLRIGAKKEWMFAILGPSINRCCYRVNGDVREEFEKKGFSENIFTEYEGGLYLSIRGANREILEKEGIYNIYDLDLCTHCREEEFYSFRRGDRTERQINFVSLE
ncbi:MAG: peptidoglycan editing factor PgeF [Syntrophorhabdaceae bacterium]|nr:peptidoglycan editing factor PgeF [Syntrophorhabdaceae bacterium]